MSPTRPRAVSRPRPSETRSSAPTAMPLTENNEQASATAASALALTPFIWGAALDTALNTLSLMTQVHSAQMQMLKDLGNVLHTARDDLQQTHALAYLWTLPASRATQQLGSTVNSWTQTWKAQVLEARPRWTEQAPSLQSPLTLLNNALLTSSRMIEAWVNTARSTSHAIVVMA